MSWKYLSLLCLTLYECFCVQKSFASDGASFPTAPSLFQNPVISVALRMVNVTTLDVLQTQLAYISLVGSVRNTAQTLCSSLRPLRLQSRCVGSISQTIRCKRMAYVGLIVESFCLQFQLACPVDAPQDWTTFAMTYAYEDYGPGPASVCILRAFSPHLYFNIMLANPMFKVFFLPSDVPTPDESLVIAAMQTLVINFARICSYYFS
jgi:hypothetical protein